MFNSYLFYVSGCCVMYYFSLSFRARCFCAKRCTTMRTRAQVPSLHFLWFLAFCLCLFYVSLFICLFIYLFIYSLFFLIAYLFVYSYFIFYLSLARSFAHLFLSKTCFHISQFQCFSSKMFAIMNTYKYMLVLRLVSRYWGAAAGVYRALPHAGSLF